MSELQSLSQPLEVVDYGHPVLLDAAECQFVVCQHGAPVAYVYRPEDAALYAAAPELLEALQGLLAKHITVARAFDCPKVAAAQAAISKALGETQ